MKIPEAGTDFEQVILAVEIMQTEPLRKDAVALESADAVVDAYALVGLAAVLLALLRSCLS